MAYVVNINSNQGPVGDLTPNDLVLYALLGRITTNNGDTYELETLYDPVSGIDIDIPQSVLNSIISVEIGDNLKNYMQWVVKLIALGAINIAYNNATSGLTATDVQAAIDEVAGMVGGAITAAGVSYNNATSGLTATDVQAAVDELNGLISAPVLSSFTLRRLSFPTVTGMFSGRGSVGRMKFLRLLSVRGCMAVIRGKEKFMVLPGGRNSRDM